MPRNYLPTRPVTPPRLRRGETRRAVLTAAPFWVGSAARVRRAGAYAALLALLALTSACGEKSVTTVSTEADAMEIIDVLRENGFEAEKREVGEGETKKWSVEIDEGWFGGGDLGLAIQVLHDHALPRPEDPPIESGGFVPSEAVERQKEQRRIRTDIERQLRALPGVTSAIVTVVLAPEPGLALNPHPATASALVIHGEAKPAFTIEQVQHMVARSVPDLKPEQVSVTMSQQTPRPVPHRELSVRRRNNMLLAAGIGLVTILGFLLIVFWLQIRRQRAQLAELRESADAAPEEVDEAEEAATRQAGGGAAAARQLGGATPDDEKGPQSSVATG